MQETSLSLLERLQSQSDPAGWERLMELYEPLIRSWLSRLGLQRTDRDDLTQEVISRVFQKIGAFQRSEEGSFRRWLRGITVNCLREFWRDAKRRPRAVGGTDFVVVLDQLQDSGHALSRVWDDEHDRHVVRSLLAIVEPLFEPTTVQAFRRTVIDGQQAAAVAAELGISVNAVLIAKSRVLRRLRQEAAGLLD
jgi:RNA polymerase sigma-70 factor (ECF subfamily)